MIPSLRASCLIALTLTLSPSQARPDTITPNLAHAVTSDDETLVARIRDFILKTTKERSADQMRPYKNTIPLTGAPYEMVNIPGGKFLMGSPSNEAHRQDDEAPQREIEIEPFWMGKFEVTWTMFEPFMITEVRRFNNGIPSSLSKTAVLPDFVSSPSPPYLEMDFGMGKDDGYPAISMTQHAASKFCQWLSAQTGHFYRLPTEAEWEYACRAGSKDAYYFGGDVAQLDHRPQITRPTTTPQHLAQHRCPIPRLQNRPPPESPRPSCNAPPLELRRFQRTRKLEQKDP